MIFSHFRDGLGLNRKYVKPLGPIGFGFIFFGMAFPQWLTFNLFWGLVLLLKKT